MNEFRVQKALEILELG